MKKKGFTLIELLVVIAIIAMLLAILMPALGKVKDKAKSVVCRSNLKQMQLASIMYNGENDGKMFLYTGNMWITKLEPFVDEVDNIRFCPVTTKVGENQIGDSKHKWYWGDELGSYAINGWIYQDNDGYLEINFYPEWSSMAYESLGNVRIAAETPCFVDCAWMDRWPLDTDKVAEEHDLDDPEAVPTTPYSHMGLMMMNRHGLAGNGSLSKFF